MRAAQGAQSGALRVMSAAKSAPSKFDLTGSPSHLLHRAQQFAADRFAEETAKEPVTQRQFAVLTAVAANEGLTQTDLVHATGIDRSTLAELVARMTRRGLLARKKAASDARANTVTLTAEGRSILNGAAPAAERADEKILSALPKNKRAGFLDTLQRIARVLDADAQLNGVNSAGKAKAKALKAKKAIKVAAKPKAGKKKAKGKGKKKS